MNNELVKKPRPFLECPKCGAPFSHGGPFGRAGVRDGVPYNEDLGSRMTCQNQHTWEVSKDGVVTVLPDPPPTPPYVRTPIPVFDEWSNLNQIMADFRSRFDVLREEMPKCKTKSEVRTWLQREGFGSRYPILPESLPD